MIKKLFSCNDYFFYRGVLLPGAPNPVYLINKVNYAASA